MNIAGSFFAGNMTSIDYCGNQFYHFKGDIYIKPSEFCKLKYKSHKHQVCKACKKNYIKVLNETTERFKKFPNCCTNHQKLKYNRLFNKNDFNNYPKLYTDKLFYTYDHILNNINEEDWKTDIFDFIDHIVFSFGQFPFGCGEALYLSAFFDRLKNLLQNKTKDSPKYFEIINFINGYNKIKDNSDIDFNNTLKIYNDWFTQFPFDLSIFSHLKNQFSYSLPPLKSSKINKYNGFANFSLLNKEELINALLKITNQIICTINVNSLSKNFNLDDANKLKLELIKEKRRQKSNIGYFDINNEKKLFQNILEEWLKDEIEFIDEIKPILIDIDKQQNNILGDILNACYKMQENKVFWNADENLRTKQILDILSSKYFTGDQNTYGESSTGIKSGSIDGLIKNNNCEVFIEALNLNSINKSEIELHIHKIENKYDSKGLYNKFIIIYCNVKDNYFENFHKKYLVHINNFNFIYRKEKIIELNTPYTNSRLILTNHIREGQNINLYHILLKMPKK